MEHLSKIRLQLGANVFELEGPVDDRFAQKAFWVWLQAMATPETAQLNALAAKLEQQSDQLAAAVQRNTPKE